MNAQHEAPATSEIVDEPERLERLKQVARLYGDAVGIIDALRIQYWSEGGLTLAQLRLLWALRDEDGLPVGSLAELLGVNPSTITGHVDRLVKQGLVRREEDSVDRRIVRNFLTDDGRVVVTSVLQVAGGYVMNILRRLDDAQLDGLVQALGDLNEAAATARREAR
ncbi:MAG TPA: MarR family transcriptional regulator [Dehalococcoidia bacterium]|nr:MarR family transcriptional regulator [Dehalococcoidia bacterium]